MVLQSDLQDLGSNLSEILTLSCDPRPATEGNSSQALGFSLKHNHDRIL